MPALVAGAHEEGGAGDRPADRAFVDQLAGGLVAAAEEGVGRAADAQTPCLAPRPAALRASGEVDAERLLRMHVLAGGDRLQADLDMGERHRQVDDDLDVGVGEQALLRSSLGCRTPRPRFRRPAGFMSATPRVEDREDLRRLEVGRADVAAADDADADPVHLFRAE